MDGSALIWIAVLIISLVAEGATAVSLVTIWFIPGAMTALTFSILNLPWWAQIAAFIIVSCISLVFTRPLASKYVNRKTVRTNFDRVIGKQGIVLETIDNLRATGVVKVDGKEWSAKTIDGAKPIQKDDIVVVERVSGVKLVVRKSIFKDL